MSSTDELRAMLDERGVEWEAFNERITIVPPNKHFIECGEHDDMRIATRSGLAVAMTDLTSAQAVEATLGRGTCRLEPYAKEICGELCHTFKCSVCKSAVANPHADYYIPSQFFKYCPFCGLEVVS